MSDIPRVKICGLTNAADARDALRLGADTVGFIFYDKSPRYIRPEDAKFLIEDLRLSENAVKKFLSIQRNVIVTGVFVNEDPLKLRKIIEDADIDLIQLSGNEPVEYIDKLGIDKKFIIKAVRVKTEDDVYKIFLYKKAGVNVLIDACADGGEFGGTGIRVNTDLLNGLNMNDIILAGGIDETNVKSIIKSVKPYGLDLSSKIESFPGKKNIDKMSLFFQNLRRAANEIA
ncbi:MAG: phosphoribosylanthranilate isomerase [Candidatus Acidulodesulfobacterium sp.]